MANMSTFEWKCLLQFDLRPSLCLTHANYAMLMWNFDPTQMKRFLSRALRHESAQSGAELGWVVLLVFEDYWGAFVYGTPYGNMSHQSVRCQHKMPSLLSNKAKVVGLGDTGTHQTCMPNHSAAIRTRSKRDSGKIWNSPNRSKWPFFRPTAYLHAYNNMVTTDPAMIIWISCILGAFFLTARLLTCRSKQR